jgi:hypothetical protein
MKKMSKPKTIMIDDEKYVRESDIQQPSPEMGEKRIVIADRGWVFVGDCTDNEDGTVTIRNTKNIRRWGTTKGLGELVNGPLSKTVADDYGTVITEKIATIAVVSGW